MLKAVIPVAGLGTRMLPATKAIPKEMLPIVDKPLVQYIIEECYAAGIMDVVFVTHSSKNAIDNHFDNSFELEYQLERREKKKLLHEVRCTCPEGMQISHVRQGLSLGLGHAILCAQPILGDNDFVVILPDVLIDNALCNPHKDNLAEMIQRFQENKASQVMVERVNMQDVTRYGIIDCRGAQPDAGESTLINGIVEKPSIEKAPSNLAVVGRYVLSAEIWPFLRQIGPSVGDEIQLTDAISMLINKSEVEGYVMKGQSYDCGDKAGYMKANVIYGCRHPTLGESFKGWLASAESGI